MRIKFLVPCFLLLGLMPAARAQDLHLRGWWIVPGFYAPVVENPKKGPVGGELSLLKINKKGMGGGLVLGGEERYRYAELEWTGF